MHNCVKCNKELAKSTKGELCQQCYRNRNKISHDNNESPENNPGNESFVSNLIDDNSKIDDINDIIYDKDDRMIINFIKSSMKREREQDAEIISILKGDINFLKDEIKHKNELINTLMSELTAAVKEVIDQPDNSINNEQ